MDLADAFRIRTSESALAESLARERLNALVSSGFALGGLLLASVRLYCVLASGKQRPSRMAELQPYDHDRINRIINGVLIAFDSNLFNFSNLLNHVINAIN